MAVNGVEINVGQKWITEGGATVTIFDYSALEVHRHAPWTVKDKFGRIWQANAAGQYIRRRRYTDESYPVDEQFNLKDLVGVTDALANPPGTTMVKETNPKEAIGDKKVPLWLCSAIAMAHWSAAQFAGLIKYGAWNWRAAGVRFSTYISAIKRHTARWENGERCDPIDGTHHLGNIMACCAILLEAEAIGKLNDDRSPSADLQKTFDEVEAMVAKLKEVYADKTPKHWTIDDKV